MLEQALPALLALVTQNEEVKKFPQKFISAGMRWVRSWFLVDDEPGTKAILDSPGNEGAKKIVLEQKLPALLANEQFVRELQQYLADFARHAGRKNIVAENAQLNIKGDAHIGDKGASDGRAYAEKNIVEKGSKIEVGGSFRLGDG